MSTDSPSRLMTLPAELRLLIFEILLIDPRGITIGSSDEKTHNVKRRDLLYDTVTPPPITRVSRQLRNGTLQAFYSNTFKVVNHEFGPHTIPHIFYGARCWLYRMGAEQRAMIKDLRLCTWPPFELLSTGLLCSTDKTSLGAMASWRRRTPRLYIGQEVVTDEPATEDKPSDECFYYRLIIEEPQGLASYKRGTRLLSNFERRAEMKPSDGVSDWLAAQQRASLKKHRKWLLESVDPALVLSALKLV
ncbi:hypothetical protein LTR15_002747 [Elasticomyces elasticus]|nr:hypothetical protein LTR15_002747 [Elasticomyces elasticus]